MGGVRRARDGRSEGSKRWVECGEQEMRGREETKVGSKGWEE